MQGSVISNSVCFPLQQPHSLAVNKSLAVFIFIRALELTEEKIKGEWYLTSFAAVLAILNVFEVRRSLIWSRKANQKLRKACQN